MPAQVRTDCLPGAAAVTTCVLQDTLLPLHTRAYNYSYSGTSGAPKGSRTVFNTTPTINAQKKSIAQVRADCPPGRLLEFLSSESGTAVDRAAEQVGTPHA